MSKCNLVVNKNPRPLRNPRFSFRLALSFFYLDPKFPNLFLADPLPMKRFYSMLQNCPGLSSGSVSQQE